MYPGYVRLWPYLCHYVQAKSGKRDYQERMMLLTIPIRINSFPTIRSGTGFLAMLFIFALSLPVSAADRPESFADLAERLSPAVVNISTTTVIENQNNNFPQFPPGSPFEDFLEEFRNRDSKRQAQALGSGFIVDPKGIVVTNNHVIEEADEIRVTLWNDETFDAELLGRDPKTDIAVLKIDPKGMKLEAVSFGNSDKLRVGDWVLAIGNPFGLGGTVTAGIVSARGRDIGSGPYDDFIQTDASINRGNSGGPLFNLDGEVVGINTAIFSQSGGSVGIGFAIASNLAGNVVDQLEEYGRTRRGWLGVFIQDITPDIAESLGLDDENGALVSSVHPDGPADEGGVQAGDVVLRFDGKTIEDMRSLPRIVAETSIGKEVEVEVLREGKPLTLKITLGELEQAEKNGLLSGRSQKQDSPRDFASLGFSVGPIDDEARKKYELPDEVNGSPLNGVIVTEVIDGSPATSRGITEGDVIRRIGQTQIMMVKDLSDGIKEARAQKKSSVLLLVRRAGRERFVAIPLE